MSEPVLRTATVSDFEDLYTLYKELVGTIEVPEGAAGRARLAQVLGHPGTTIHAAELGGRLVSMATLHMLPNMTFGGRPYALAENVVTLQACQGRGQGAGGWAGWSWTIWRKLRGRRGPTRSCC